MIELALAATMNLLRACHNSDSVKRVVLTSSILAATQVPHDGNTPLDVDETCWTSVDYCLENKMSCWGYMVAKTLSEKAAFQYAKEKGLDLVSILPSVVGGPFMTPYLPDSVSLCMSCMKEMPEWMVSFLEFVSYLHVDDCARAHILLMEDARAEGRYLCSACDATFRDVLHESVSLLQSFKVPVPKLDVPENNLKTRAFYKANTTKLKELGFTYQFDTIHKILKDMVPCLLKRGYLKLAEEEHSS
ncbi:hypothetical protein L7F22_008252 [Adiantum nelumboides]|nr:hypothetical protein [Adiantum nelumboides]